jgi:hypothetical protein
MAVEEPDYWLDIRGLEANSESVRRAAGRRWIGVRFDCCGAYQRIYKNAEGTAYVGRCPQCLREVRVKVGPGGTSSRFFVAE